MRKKSVKFAGLLGDVEGPKEARSLGALPWVNAPLVVGWEWYCTCGVVVVVVVFVEWGGGVCGMVVVVVVYTVWGCGICVGGV